MCVCVRAGGRENGNRRDEWIIEATGEEARRGVNEMRIDKERTRDTRSNKYYDGLDFFSVNKDERIKKMQARRSSFLYTAR